MFEINKSVEEKIQAIKAKAAAKRQKLQAKIKAVDQWEAAQLQMLAPAAPEPMAPEPQPEPPPKIEPRPLKPYETPPWRPERVANMADQDDILLVPVIDWSK